MGGLSTRPRGSDLETRAVSARSMETIVERRVRARGRGTDTIEERHLFAPYGHHRRCVQKYDLKRFRDIQMLLHFAGCLELEKFANVSVLAVGAGVRVSLGLKKGAFAESWKKKKKSAHAVISSSSYNGKIAFYWCDRFTISGSLFRQAN